MDLRKPLEDDELATLATFLDLQEPGHDVMLLSEAHGFLTALLSGPEPVPPDEWMPCVFGDAEFEDLRQAEELAALLLRLHNHIAGCLTEPGLYTPVLEEWQDHAGRAAVAADAWCRGYVEGMSMASRRWEDHADGVLGELLLPIMLILQPDEDGDVIENDPDSYDMLCRMLPRAAQAIYDYWLDFRATTGVIVDSADTVRPDRAPRPGSPCPCGSRQRFEQCCGALHRLH